MFKSLAFLYAARSFPRSFADSAERSLSINTNEKRELFINFFLFPQTQSESILETKQAKIGHGRGGRDVPSLVFVGVSLFAAPQSKKPYYLGSLFGVWHGTLCCLGQRRVQLVLPLLYSNIPRCFLHGSLECYKNQRFSRPE